ncbi:glycosyltransferase family 4 protein [Sinorhizobium americanum]|uniref:Glycosyltransferase, forming alpha glycosyl linkage n=1 Tax=Sinorhizobium americanum TaxID=194963 RepID=A0A1L3LV99_9HYPH|nr:glycosyltransferase family 4 protein [Sinorhizobium americanum]APG93953.1 glycosyltransferase, forming alpha glycosyl linkage [Sinorhizobium americanum]OAP34062.1 glycosyl transferase [Sinorhizobium americanum]
MNELLRVLVVSHGHPAMSLGGAEIASHSLHKGLNALPEVESIYLARTGHPVPRHGASALMSLRLTVDEVLYHADDYDHFFLSNGDTDAIRRDLLRFVGDLKPHVVHFHHIIGMGLEAVYALREALPHSVIVVTFHEYLPICHNHGQMVKRASGQLCSEASPISCHGCFPEIPVSQFLKREQFVRGMLDLADAFVSPSMFLATRYVEWGIEAEKLSVIENGIVMREPAPARDLPAPATRRNRFAYFGQMTPFKGIDVLIDAVSRVPEEIWGDDSCLMIYGGNLERQPLEFQDRVKKLIDEAGRRVRFYGAYQNGDLPRLMRSVDWVVLPSIWWENSPIVIQEALHHRRPIICSDIGGMAEKVQVGRDGLHFRAGSAQDLADRLVEVLSEPQAWDRLHASLRPPMSHIDSARQQAELYRRLLREKLGQANAANPAVLAHAG